MSVSLPHWDVSVRSSRPSTVAPAEPGRGRTRSEEPVLRGGEGEGGDSLRIWGVQTQMLVGPVVLIDVFLILSDPLVPTLTRPAQARPLRPGFFDGQTRSERRFGPGVTVASFWSLPILFPSAGPCNLLVLVKNALVACGLLKWFR